MQAVFTGGVQSTWHRDSTDVLLEKLQTSVTGLSQEDAETRFATHGANGLPQASRSSAFIRFLLQFHNVLIYVLTGSVLITASLRQWIDTGCVHCQRHPRFSSRGKGGASHGCYSPMLPPRPNMIRNGERITIDGKQLISGDIVLLEAGDKVPADFRLLTAYGMSAQEETLTGESVPVEKHTQPMAENSALGGSFPHVFLWHSGHKCSV